MVSRPRPPLTDDPLNHPLGSSELDRQSPDGPVLLSFRPDVFQVRLRKLPERWPSDVLSFSPRFVHAHRYSAANKVVLKLGHSANNMKQQPTRRAGAI